MMKVFAAAALLIAVVNGSCIKDGNGKCTFTIVPYKIARLAYSDAPAKFSVAGMYDTPDTRLALTIAGLDAMTEIAFLDIEHLIEIAVQFKCRFFSKAIGLLHQSPMGIFAGTPEDERIRNNSKRSNVVYAEFLVFLEDFYRFLTERTEETLNKVLMQFSYELPIGLRRILVKVTLRAELERYIDAGEYDAPKASWVAKLAGPHGGS